VFRALLIECRALLIELRALLIECRPLLIECRPLLIECRPLFIEYLKPYIPDMCVCITWSLKPPCIDGRDSSISLENLK